MIAGIAPFDREVLRANMIEKFPMNRTVEQTMASFAAIKDFDVRAMSEIAGQCKNQPAAYGRARSCSSLTPNAAPAAAMASTSCSRSRCAGHSSFNSITQG